MAADKDVRYTVTAEDRFSQTFSRLKRELADGGDQLGRITTLSSRAASALSLVSLGGLAAGGGFGLMVRRLASDIDALNDASDALGDSVGNLSALEDLARRNGEGLDLVSTAVSRLNKTLGDAKADSPLAKAISAVGLSAAELRQLEPTEALRRVAVALQGYQNDGNKARIVQELFGKSSREVASFLKDLAEAGELNATVTDRQAAAAERFNKELAALSTNANNLARSAASGLIPLLNEDLIRLRTAQDVFGGLTSAVFAFVKEGERFTDAGAGVAFYSRKLNELRASIKNLQTNGSGIFDKLNADKLKEQVKDVERLEQFYRRVFALTSQDNGQSDPRELARRGRGPALLPSVSGPGDEKKPAQISEAERYLENLERQAEKLQDLTVVQQLLADLEGRRIAGVNPQLRTRLFLEAANLDVLKAQDKALRDQQQSLDDLIAGTERRSSELEALLADTSAGRAKTTERKVTILLNYARANPEDEAIQRQALEAVKKLRAELEGTADTARNVDTEVNKLNVTLDRFADQTVDAMVDMALGVEGASERLYEAFKRDLLRELIEDPVRDSMRNVVKTIKDELGKLEGDSIWSQLGKLFSLLGGAGGGAEGGGYYEVGGGYVPRASGGKVRAGQMVKWQENGVEYFRPETDGQVLTEGQMAAGGAQVFNTNNITIVDARDPAATAREVRAMLDARDARAMRQARFGASAVEA